MKKASVVLSAAAMTVCAILLAGLCIAAPTLVELYSRFRGLDGASGTAILTAFYICALPAAVSIFCLLKIIDNIYKDQPFMRSNSVMMGIVSWCCLGVAAVCAAAGVWYMPLWFITLTMTVLFLIVCVIRCCFIAAAGLEEENSLTI